MKNIINCFYGVKPDTEIIAKGNYDFYFFSENNLYCLSELNMIQVKRIIELNNNYIVSQKFHNILLNKNHSLFSVNKGSIYILMKINCKNNKLTYVDILKYYKWLQQYGLMFNYKQINWSELWRKKIDYLEYYVNQNQSINNNIRCLCNYFVGISENAILLINFAVNDYGNEFLYEQVTFCHERIKKEDTSYDLYNPKNIILDHYSRDVSEYLKNLVFFDNYIDILEKLIGEINFSNVGYILLLARTMFPTFFFDLLNEIENSSFDDRSLIGLYDYINRYEELVIRLYFLIRKKIRLPHIEWLTNLNQSSI